MAQTNQNGARAKIMRALIINGMLTTVELAQQTGLTAQQVRDNANAAVADRLVIKGKDCVTGALGYQITALGRLWNDGQLQNARATLSATTGGETAHCASKSVPVMINDTIPLALRVQIEQIAARAAQLRPASARNAILQEAKARMRAGSHNASRMRAEETRKAYLDAIAYLGGCATTRQIADTIGVTVSDAKAQTASMLASGHLQYEMFRNLRVWQAADGSY